MNDAIHRDLPPLLADPDTGRPLALAGDRLVATGSGREFPVVDGIPHLFPTTFDRSRLDEESDLARMMRRDRTSRRARLSASEWAASKAEFWSLVEGMLGADPKTVLNLGSGLDAGFKPIQDAGHRVVQFDIVHENLAALRSEHGAVMCVAGDLSALPFRPETADAVVAIDLVHHEADRLDDVIESLARLLRTGGTLFLQDVNAWGLFQWPKSILLPRPVHRSLRVAYHRWKRSTHQPAEYEFPTDFRVVCRVLARLGLESIRLHPTRSYPNAGPAAVGAYRAASRARWAACRLGFHYTLTARKP